MVSFTRRRYFFLLVLIIFLNFDGLSQDCSKCQKQLLQKVNEVEKLAVKLDLLEVKENALIEQLTDLKKKSNISGIKSDQKSFDQISKQNIALHRNITRLNASLLISQGDVRKLKNDISTYQQSIENLNKGIASLTEKNQKLQDIINCVKDFERQSKLSEPEITKELVNARNNYTEYKRLGLAKNLLQDKQEKLIKNVISTYENYKGKKKEFVCGDIKLSFFQDYLTVEDYINIAEIYGKNKGNAVTKLDSTNQINEANRRVLDAAGVVMEKGNYDDRSLIISKLKSYITPERRPGPINSEVKHNLETIPTAFKKEKYFEALNTYSKYEKYLNLDEVKSEKNLIDEVKYSIGSILLWDLGSYDQELFSIIDNDWLSGYQNYKQCGLAYLSDLVNDKSVRLDLRKKASITLNKYYE